jgi:hypothetical protein
MADRVYIYHECGHGTLSSACDDCTFRPLNLNWQQWESAGVDTEGCDCGHEGMGEQWHLRGCAWRNS